MYVLIVFTCNFHVVSKITVISLCYDNLQKLLTTLWHSKFCTSVHCTEQTIISNIVSYRDDFLRKSRSERC